MTQFNIPNIGPSLSERLFNIDPQNDCEKAGFYISSIPTCIVGWSGRVIKEINFLNGKLENSCICDDAESTSKMISKYAANIIGKMALLTVAAAAYFTATVVSAVDLIGIAIRTLGLPLEDKNDDELSDSSVLIKIRLVDAPQVNVDSVDMIDNKFDVIIEIEDLRKKVEHSEIPQKEVDVSKSGSEKPAIEETQRQLDVVAASVSDPKDPLSIGSRTTITYPAFAA